MRVTAPRINRSLSSLIQYPSVLRNFRQQLRNQRLASLRTLRLALPQIRYRYLTVFRHCLLSAI
jgi:hypothetical protein